MRSFVIDFDEAAVQIPDPVNNKLVQIKIDNGPDVDKRRFHLIQISTTR